VVRAEISTSLTPEARDRFEHREELAAAAAVQALLCPRSIAVIGASRKRHTIGGDLFHNLIDGDFAGPVYPVNPAALSVQGVRAFASILDIPDPVEVAVVVVLAESVADVARQCARKGVRGLIVVSAGVSGIGPSGSQTAATRHTASTSARIPTARASNSRSCGRLALRFGRARLFPVISSIPSFARHAESVRTRSTNAAASIATAGSTSTSRSGRRKIATYSRSRARRIELGPRITTRCRSPITRMT
jgi:predicted CoA-binding protein